VSSRKPYVRGGPGPLGAVAQKKIIIIKCRYLIIAIQSTALAGSIAE